MLNSPLWRRLIVFASALFLGVLVLGGFLLPRTAFTQATPPQAGAAKGAATQCSAATLKGTYVYAFDGYHISGKDRVPGAGAGLDIFDGNGHGQGVFSLSIDGKISRSVSYTVKITVHSDCTATETDTDQTGAVSHYDDFLVPDGSHFTWVETDPGFVTSAIETRGTGK
jgi:hypothetical protein